MKPKPTPSKEVLITLIDYNPETGVMIWKERHPSLFEESARGSNTSANVWNGKNAGKPALASRTANGYLHGAILNDSFLAHRIAWKIATGADADDIDHINGDRADNRLVNLRSCTRHENMRNRGLSRNNRSGHHGVWIESKTGKWIASIENAGVVTMIGRYSSREDAVFARRQAESALGFHPNHGTRDGHISTAFARAT